MANLWKESFLKRRCIVPADSFYEWRQTSKNKKDKYEFKVPQRLPFGMAGLWAPWTNSKTGQRENTFAIVTVEANSVMKPVHDRQPSILEPREYAAYLGASDRPPLHLLRILPGDEMQATLVGQSALTGMQASLFDSQ